MKKYLFLPLLALALCGVGCRTSAVSTTPPAALAPGYSSPDDQTAGQSLAALNAFVLQEQKNYATLSIALQAREKTYLNVLIDAVNVANSAYTAFHAGTGTLATAQSAVATAQTAQTTLTSAKGAKQ